MAKFDPKRPHATVHGGGALYSYEQDGKYFQSNGDECDSDGNPVKEAPRPVPAETKPEPTEEGDGSPALEPNKNPPKKPVPTKGKTKGAPFAE